MSFFYNHPSTTEIYTLSLHDALPILPTKNFQHIRARIAKKFGLSHDILRHTFISMFIAKFRSLGEAARSEEHTSELQSPMYLVCRLLLEKKKNTKRKTTTHRQPYDVS